MTPAPAEDILIPLPSRVLETRHNAADVELGAADCALLDDPTLATPARLASSGAIDLVREHRASDGTELGDEGFELVVSGRIRVTAGEPAGALYAIQALRQLARAGRSGAGSSRLASTHIIDVPDQTWRELTLDVARRFYPVDEVLRIIDLAATYRLNRFHLHLTDDQGWRIEIPGHPELTAVGSTGAVDDRPGGSYSTHDFARMVAYAAARAVTVIPEVDLPGHTNALLVAHPELAADVFADPVSGVVGAAPAPYHGIEVGFSCVDVESQATRALVSEIFTELARITPGPYLHFGGDEVHRLPRERFVPFVRWLADLVRMLGKIPVAWHEAGWAELDSDVILEFWNVSDPEPIEKTIVSGGQIVNFPSAHSYFDMKYAPDSPLGLTWAGVTPVRQAYEWEASASLGALDPEFALARVGAERVEAVLDAARAVRAAARPTSVAGVGCALWGETVSSLSDAEWLLLPRLLAFAEVAWTPSTRRSWEGFVPRVTRQIEWLREDGHTVYGVLD